jgi:hypothetical protein
MRRNLLVAAVCAAGAFGLTMLVLSPATVDATGPTLPVKPLEFLVDGLMLHANYGGVQAQSGPGIQVPAGSVPKSIELIASNIQSSEVKSQPDIRVSYRPPMNRLSRVGNIMTYADPEALTLQLKPGEQIAHSIAIPDLVKAEPGGRMDVSLIQGNLRTPLLTLNFVAESAPPAKVP